MFSQLAHDFIFFNFAHCAVTKSKSSWQLSKKSRIFDSSLGHWLLLLATMQVIYHGLFMNSQLIQFKTHSYKINLYNGTFLLLTFKLLFVQENCNLGLSLLYLHSKLLQSLCQLCSSLKLYKQVQKLNLEASLKDFKKFRIFFKS